MAKLYSLIFHMFLSKAIFTMNFFMPVHTGTYWYMTMQISKRQQSFLKQVYVSNTVHKHKRKLTK